jgi:hypothetical protein
VLKVAQGFSPAIERSPEGETLYRTKCAYWHDRPAAESRAKTREALLAFGLP